MDPCCALSRFSKSLRNWDKLHSGWIFASRGACSLPWPWLGAGVTHCHHCHPHLVPALPWCPPNPSETWPCDLFLGFLPPQLESPANVALPNRFRANYKKSVFQSRSGFVSRGAWGGGVSPPQPLLCPPSPSCAPGCVSSTRWSPRGWLCADVVPRKSHPPLLLGLLTGALRVSHLTPDGIERARKGPFHPGKCRSSSLGGSSRSPRATWGITGKAPWAVPQFPSLPHPSAGKGVSLEGKRSLETLDVHFPLPSSNPWGQGQSFAPPGSPGAFVVWGDPKCWLGPPGSLPGLGMGFSTPAAARGSRSHPSVPAGSEVP